MKTAATILAIAAVAQASPVPAVDNNVRDLLGLIGLGDKEYSDVPFTFTSTYSVIAVPEEVVDSMTNVPTGGLPGCTGLFNYGINTIDEVICYNITIDGFQGEYESAATTATHIHAGEKGLAGPPRIAFPNPEPVSKHTRTSVGCMKGPFKTGVVTDGVDSGDGFTLSMIEANPALFFTDTHSSLAVPGAVRGQLDQKNC